MKRHLQRLGAGVNLETLTSLVEDKDMLAENLENLLRKERLKAYQEGYEEGYQETKRKIFRNLLVFRFGQLPNWVDEQLQKATPEQLAVWSEQVLVADSLEALFTQ
ncbi:MULTISPECIES: hypothetical protein [Halomonas]|uniref:DUF4351 domain-containing protein n=1 Tax=Halomonas citrativorans TaxID=2742612 RepID=A0ABR9FFM8_9GAMM|nr:hypothetical protein [Halomonas citrativorans]MBE0405302.1 hypothetical protein [Halomonas citrativorans]